MDENKPVVLEKKSSKNEFFENKRHFSAFRSKRISR